MYISLLKLNLFKHPYNDDFGRRSEVLSTRFYIVLMTISFIILTLYASIIVHTETVQVRTPSIMTYERLAGQYNNTLTCACANITTPYQTFISLIPVSYKNV